MKPHRVILSLAVAFAASAVSGGQPAALADAPCAHTDVVLYSLDSTALAQQLGTVPSACADYWISVGPYTAAGPNFGKPKFLPGGPVIHAQGPQFHALAEIKLGNWCPTTVADPYATGQMLHAAMLAEGFDPARDAWAVNEAGAPSNDACAAALLSDASARETFALFVHGLHDGSPGDVPMAGAVFAASPAQLAAPADLAPYRQALASWYADTGFWQAMDRDVRFWGQEAYADSRAWGVDGGSLDDRAASLNDYFMFGRRLAAGDGDAAAAAFFAHAYTPLGNASWKQPAPTARFGPGFGETDNLTAAGMKSFISGQVYAFRSWIGTRFGFAVVPKNAGTDKNPIELQIGVAVRDSETNATGACAIASCDTIVAGAAFADAWRGFASPPAIAPTVVGDKGADGWYTGDVHIAWSLDGLDSPLTSTGGCDAVTVASDTAGTTYTCTATNRGGRSSSSVTVRRDTTPPQITCVPTPAVLWPPNGKLVPVAVAVRVEDETSGPAGFVLTAAPDADAVGFDVGTPDVTGLLRAARPGNGDDRTYTLSYLARDAAGNTATCEAVVVVPHDKGGGTA